MTERPPYAPGCFGSALSFSKDEVCGACAFAAQCEPVHLRALAQLKDFYGVKTPTRAKSDLPVKVKKLFDELNRSEEEVREAMLAGTNPYPVSEGFVGVICHLILTAKQITRPTLERALAAHRGLNEETSSFYTRQALHILRHCGAVDVDGKTVTLRHSGAAQE